MQREANPCNSCGLTLGGFIARARSSNKALSCTEAFNKLALHRHQVEELSKLQSPLQGTARKKTGSNVPKVPESDLRTIPLSSQSYAHQ